MSTKSSVNVANGFVSAILLACGIILCILIALLYGKLYDAAVQSSVPAIQLETEYSRAITSWVVGFTFIIPGFFGIIASLIRMKHGFILQLVLFIIALCAALVIHAGAIRDVAVYRLFALKVSCPIFISCEEADRIVNMGIGAGVMVVLGWIFAFIGIITAGYLISQHKKPKGMVYRNAPLTVAAPWAQYPKHPYGYTPQAVPVAGLASYGQPAMNPYREKSRGYKLRVLGSYPVQSEHVAQDQHEILPGLSQSRPVVQTATNLAYVDDYDEIPHYSDPGAYTKLAHLKNDPKFLFNQVTF